MIGIIVKVVLMGMFVVLLACALGLFVMAGVAQSHDIVHIPLPPATFIASTEPKASHSEAYIAPLRYSSFRDIDRVDQLAFHRGQREVYRDEHEVAYEGEAIGLRYVISYILSRETSPQTIAVATTVTFKDKKGFYLWKVLKHVQRRLLPYLLDRMVVTAPD
jgi:hypothetical protein